MRRIFGFLFTTKLGLLLFAALIFGLSQVYSLPATEYMRHESSSTGTDVSLRLVYFALMCLVAFSETLLVDELFFHGGWRRRVLGGRKSDIFTDAGDAREDNIGVETGEESAGLESAQDEDHGDLLREGDDTDEGERRYGKVRERDDDFSIKGSLFKDYTVHVTLVFLFLLAGNYYLFNAINGRFDKYYGDVGYLYTRLRSPDSKIRRSAIASLTPKRISSVSQRLLERLEKGDSKEKLWAIWGLGYRAEYALLSTSMRQEAAGRILPHVEKGPEKKRAMAAVALARLKSYSWLEHAVDELEKPAPHPYFAVALGLLRDHRPRALKGLTALLLDSNENRAMAAAWALGQMKVQDAAEPLRDKLFEMKGPVQCVAVESLGRLGDTNAVPLLVRLFEKEKSGLICPQKELKLRPDGEGGDKFFLFHSGSNVYKKLGCSTKREPLRVRILKVLWRIGETRIVPWIRKMAESGLLAPREKDCAVRVYNSLVD